jgi:tetratricopeptide (TPR) repeat protein
MSRVAFAMIVLAAALAASPSFAQTAPQGEDDLAVQLQQAAEELASLEDQITREESRLSRLESELVDLRRQQAFISSAESAFRLGEELYTAGSIVWARDAFEAVITNFPESEYYPDALFRLELISFELQDFDMALQYYTTLSTVYPGFGHMDLARLAAALSYHNSSKFEEARQLLAQIPPQSEYGALAEYLTAVAYVEEGNVQAAKTALEAILSHSRTRREEAALADRARIALAQTYVDEGSYEEAHDLYDDISPYSPYYDVGMLGKVWTYMRQENYQEAYNLAERVLNEVPATELRSEFELAMANCALGAEDLDVAIARYRNLLEENRGATELGSLIFGDTSASSQQYEDERERLERMRIGLAEMKEEAYATGNLDLVQTIEEEEAALREMFVQISAMETAVSLPTGDIDTEDMNRELSRLISESRSSTDALALSVQEVARIADERGTQADRDQLASLEAEIQRIRLSLQDLASKFDSGMTQEHDWVQETQYGIAIANYMERELMRDSLSFYGAYYQGLIQTAYAEGDSASAGNLISQRQSQTSALQGRIRRAAETCTGLFEEYLANFPESRFSADVLVRLAQLYYDLDNATYLDRIASGAGFDSTGGSYILEDYSRSIELYERVLTNYPGSEVEDVALYSLGYCQDKMGDPQGAVGSYRRLLADHPQSALAPETNIRAGDFYFDSFQFDSARVFYEKTLNYPAADPDLFQLGVYKLGWTHYLLNDYLRSAATFAYLIRDSQLMDSLGIPRRGGAMVNEAMEYMAHDFMEQPSLPSVSLATRFLDSFGNDSVSYRVLGQMGNFYEEQGYWPEAIASYEALLQRFPDSPQAPFLEVRIASSYEGAGDLEMATQARERLVEQYGSGSEWATTYGTSETSAVVDSIRALSLEQTIAYYHNQALVNREDPVLSRQNYDALAGRIEVYLRDYPQSRQNYDFRFFLGDAYYALGRFTEAGDCYTAVATDSSSVARQEDACINACGSYFTAYAEQPAIDSAAVRQKQIDATNLYMARFPGGQYVDQFLFTAGGNAYNAGDYPNARTEYQTLYNNYPSSQYVARSARFIAAAFEAESMFTQAEDWYGRAADAAARTGEDLGEDFDLLAATAAYRDASALAESEDVQSLISAARRFEESADSHPESAVAPTALYDAAETYAKAGALDDAMRVFDELARRYPTSELAPQGLLRSAFLAREAGRFVDAGDIYQAAFQQFPGAPDMGSALYSAAISYEDGGRMDLAISVYDQLIATSSASAEAMVLVYGKYGEYLYQRYDYARARQMMTDCMTVYDQYREGDAYYPAMSAFYLGEMSYQDYSAVVATVETAQTKTQLMQATEAWYGKALTYFTDVWFMAACVRAGELYEDYANAIGYMEPPEGLDEAGIQAFYDQLYPVMESYLQKALEVYQTAVEKAISSGISNEWVYKAADHLELMAPGMVNSIGYLPGWSGAVAPADTTTTPQTPETGQPQPGTVESSTSQPGAGQGSAGGGV